MTNPGLPPPLSSAHREREAARVIDLRQEIEKALDELDAALDASASSPDPSNGRGSRVRTDAAA